MLRAKLGLIAGAVMLALLSWPRLHAGGPLVVDSQSGMPYSWQVPPEGPPDAFYNLETGPLNAFVDHAAAQAMVADSFQVWQDVSTATITYADAGVLRDCSQAAVPNCSPGAPLDVNNSNLFQVFGVADGQSPIIFDADGSIFSLLGLPPGVLAFASPEIATAGFPYAILEGIAVFNGVALANDVDLIRAVMVHEFGHFSNLAHSAVNGQAIFFGDQTGPSPNDPFNFGPPPPDSIETMYPFLGGTTSLAAQTLHRDDIASLTAIYPAPGMPGPPGSITGRVLRSDGATGISGVNVIARNLSDPFYDAVAVLSGDFTQGAGPLGPDDGTYMLRGLDGGNYAVYIDQILQGGFSTPPASGFEEECYNGAGESSDPNLDDPAVCSPVSVTPAAAGIDVILQSLPPDLNEPNDDPASATPVVCGEQFEGVAIDPVGDLDYYAIDLQADEELVVDIDAANQGSALDSLVGVFAPDGVTLLASNDDEGLFSLDSLLKFTAPQAGRYFVAVTSWDDFNFDGSSNSGSGSLTTGAYQVDLGCIPPAMPLDFETGRLLVDQDWQTVSLSRPFVDPVVITGPVASGNSEEAIVRLRNVSSASFEIRLQEWSFLDGAHPAEDVSYLVIERGRFVLPNGARMEAGSITTDNTGVPSFQSVELFPGFPASPIVLASVGSYNDPNPVTTRIRGVSNAAFELTLQEEEGADQVHGAETIFFLAWQAGSGSSSATLAGTPSVDQLDYVASSAGVSHLFTPLPASSLEVRVQEERSADAEVGHLEETVGYLILGRYGQTPILLAGMQTTLGIDPAALRWRQIPLRLETGSVVVDHTWKTVQLPSTFSNPVVLAQSPSYYGANPGVIRIQNITSNSFQIRFQEWLYLDGLHTAEEVTYLVIEAGLWNLPDGSRLQAGFLETSQTGVGAFLSVTFLDAFPSVPVLIASVNTFNGAQTVTTRVRQVSTEGFEITMQEEEANDQVHVSERLAFAAWEPGGGTFNGFPYVVSRITATDNFTPVPSSPFELKIDEEQSLDPEAGHGQETLGFMLLNDRLLAGMQTTNDSDPASLRWRTPLPGLETGLVAVDQDWRTVQLNRQYNDPVIVARPASHHDPDPGVLRLRNVTGNSFEIRFQEWLYLDGDHSLEEAAFLVMESGRFFLPSGAQVEAGWVEMSNTGVNSFVGLSFFSAFPSPPAVFSSIMTVNGNQTVTSRIHDVTQSGFLITMQEEEANDQIHVQERIGYFAWESGAGTLGSQRFEAGAGFSANGAFTPLTFSQAHTSAPCLVADMQTAAGPDPANLRYRNLTATGVEILVDEESSADAETGHLFEDVGFLVIDCPSVTATPAGENLLLVSSEPPLPPSENHSPSPAGPVLFPVHPLPAPGSDPEASPLRCESSGLVFPWSLVDPEIARVEAIVVNPHAVPVDMELIALSGEGIERRPERRFILPHETVSLVSDSLVPAGDVTALVVRGDLPLDGFMLLGPKAGGVLTGFSVRLPQAQDMTFSFAEGRVSDGGALFLFNPELEAAEVVLELVDGQGQVATQASRRMGSRSSDTLSMAGVFQSVGGADWSYLRVRSTLPLQAMRLDSSLTTALAASGPAHRIGRNGVVLPEPGLPAGGTRMVLHLINTGRIPARVQIERDRFGSPPTAPEEFELQSREMIRLPLRSVGPPAPEEGAGGYLRLSVEGDDPLEEPQVVMQSALYSDDRIVGWLPAGQWPEAVLQAPVPSARWVAAPALIRLPWGSGRSAPLSAELFEGRGALVAYRELGDARGRLFELEIPPWFQLSPGFIRVSSSEPALSGGFLYWSGGIIPLAPSVLGCQP